jgi:hypothetical protein
MNPDGSNAKDPAGPVMLDEVPGLAASGLRPGWKPARDLEPSPLGKARRGYVEL